MVVGDISERQSHCVGMSSKPYRLEVIAECKSEYEALARLRRERALARLKMKGVDHE